VEVRVTKDTGTGNCLTHVPSRLRTWLVLLLLLIGPPCAQADGVLVVASSTADLYSRFTKRFTTVLADIAPAAEASGISVLFLDSRRLTDADIAARDLVVTVGSRAARDVLARQPAPPVLHTILPESVYRQLASSAGACARQSAIFIDQPLARQAALGRAMFPAALDYGILLGPTSRQRRAEIDAMQERTELNLVIATAGQETDIAATASGLLEKVDLLLAVNDPLVLNRQNAKWLLYSAYQRRLPVIGFSRAYVDAGAAGAVYSEPGQMARQAAEIVRDYFAGPDGCLPAAGFARDFRIAVNQSVCSSLGGASCDEHALGERLADEESEP
jgi:ABC-type uncharacterized transport system substrate-binding protein